MARVIWVAVKELKISYRSYMGIWKIIGFPKQQHSIPWHVFSLLCLTVQDAYDLLSDCL